MKEELKKSLNQALKSLEKEHNVILSKTKIEIKENKEKEFGDFSSNLALVLSKELSKPPKDIAEMLLKELGEKDFIDRMEIAGPGFINFFLSHASRTEILKIINKEKNKFGFSTKKKAEKDSVLIEYVSSNPTGPLHVGHGRGAAFGSVLASILKATGHQVDEEYYVNDQGRQTEILSLSVWLRYLEIFNQVSLFPNNCYQGAYIESLAKELEKDQDKKFCVDKELEKEISQLLSLDLTEEELDNLIAKSKELLKKGFKEITTFALENILQNIERDLKAFGVEHNKWFKESSMFSTSRTNRSLIGEALDSLKSKKKLYEKDGALWFQSTDFGDEKDRVVKRENGATTYFASDIAYHANKFNRGYSKIINVWGADHHGYLPRVKAAMSALGEDTDKFEVIFIQFANLIRGGKKLSMSTRAGEFISLNELIEEVTSEAARFFFINRKGNQHLDFDLDLAKEESKDNPLYYIQYAHARICSVFDKLKENKKSYKESVALEALDQLNSDQEVEIQQLLSQFPDVINRSAENYEPHLICYYLRNLAGTFHSYYNNERILVEEENTLQAKLFLISAVKQVLFNGLKILSISAPESM
jgi:arginyl-tRNA synthetase